MTSRPLLQNAVPLVFLIIACCGEAGWAGPTANGNPQSPLFPDRGEDASMSSHGKPGGKQRYMLFAQAMGSVLVQLNAGGSWQVTKGDLFPVIMFKERQTIAVLQLAGTNFRLATDWLKLVEPKDVTEEQFATYRAAAERYQTAQDAKDPLPAK